MPSLRKPISKAEKSLILVCVFVALPLAGLVYLYGGRDAEPNWNIPPAVPRPNPNGYDFFVAAAKATVRFTPEIDAASDTTFNPPNSPYVLKNYSLARREKWLKANARTFAFFNQGLTTPSMIHTYQLATQPKGEWASLRQVARDVSARTRTFQMQKQPMRATMSALDGIQMGQDTMRGGGIIPYLVSVAVMTISRNPLDDWNKTINSLNADEARTAAHRLEAILDREPTAAQILTVDKEDTLEESSRVFATQGWRGPLKPQNKNDGINIDETAFQAWQRQIISKRTFYADLNLVLDEQIAIAKSPYSQAQNAVPHINLDVLTLRFPPLATYIVKDVARSSTSNNMLLLRLALRAYTAEHGVAPPAIAALKPDYLKSIPVDVYNDGKPLFYMPQGKTYKLWSVGPDGINNGGVSLTRPPQDKPGLPTLNRLDSQGDFVAGLCR